MSTDVGADTTSDTSNVLEWCWGGDGDWTDLYESTRGALDWLTPLVDAGTLLLCWPCSARDRVARAPEPIDEPSSRS